MLLFSVSFGMFCCCCIFVKDLITQIFKGSREIKINIIIHLSLILWSLDVNMRMHIHNLAYNWNDRIKTLKTVTKWSDAVKQISQQMRYCILLTLLYHGACIWELKNHWEKCWQNENYVSVGKKGNNCLRTTVISLTFQYLCPTLMRHISTGRRGDYSRAPHGG